MRIRFLKLAAILLLGAPLIGAGDADHPRFNDLGHRLMCTCGCNQILLECNHVGCPESDGMRQMLSAGIQGGQSDKNILSSFTDKYGPTVLAAPTTHGFDLAAWWMPAIILLAGGTIAVMVAKRWNRVENPELAAASARAAEGEARDDLLERARRETEL
jgi:cytochrome c-type biogenesis protein CcmH